MDTRIETQIKPSVCPLDCPDTCSLSVEVAGGEVVAVKGSRANPYTAGAVCEKVVKHYPSFVHGDLRLRRPLIRSGARGSGEFTPVSWDEALDRVHAGLSGAIEAYGPESVMPLNYAGPHGQLAGGSMDRRFFHRLGATCLDRGPLCGAVRGAAYTSLFGQVPGMAPEQAAHADVIAVWGNNVTVSNLHLARVIKRARERGAKLIVVDPKRTRIAKNAHLYLQTRPGSDVVLALALAAELERRGAVDHDFVSAWVEGYTPFMTAARTYTRDAVKEICGIEERDFESLADLYQGAQRLALSIGNGMERGANGGSSLRAIMALNALTGQLGRPGAGVIAKASQSFPLSTDRLQQPDRVPDGTRTLNIVDVGRHLLDRSLDPPIKAVFIYNHNPVCTHPDQNRIRQGLSREDLFVVGCDVAFTDSMRYADVVLPASSHFECHDLYAAYGQNYLQRAEPVIPPVGESLPNTEIFRQLAMKFGFEEDGFRSDDLALMDEAVDVSDSRMSGCLPSELSTDGAMEMQGSEGQPFLVCGNVTPATPSGRVELYSDALETRYGFGIPRHVPVTRARSLTLISPSSPHRTNSTFGGLSGNDLETLEIHPEDAGRNGVSDGDEVTLSNDFGEVVLRARVTEDVPVGVVYSAKGTWLGTSPSGQTVNALISADNKADIMDGACYNDTFVDIARRNP